MSRPTHPFGCACQTCKEWRADQQINEPARDLNTPEAIKRRKEAALRQREEAHAKKIAALDASKKYLVQIGHGREWLYPKDIPVGAHIFNAPTRIEIVGSPAPRALGVGAPGYPNREEAPRDGLWTKDADRRDD